MSGNKLNIVDMFCGGGGESTGLIEAAHDYNFEVNMSAINHWERAIETHAKNYPFAEHRCENVQHIEPRTLAASRNTDLMWASPGCQHFSVARGGKPLSTICTKQEHCLVSPMLIQYYGNGHAVPLTEPIPTLTTKERYAIVGTDNYGIELGFRMLQPNELAAATGFPAEYEFTGNKVEVVKQIGNAVTTNFAKALFSQILKEMVS